MIDNLILEMLQSEGRVTIPTVGTFVMKGGETSFISFLKSEDPKFAQFVASRFELSQQEGVEIVNEFASALMTTIKSNGHFVMTEVGQLTLDANGILIFVALPECSKCACEALEDIPQSADDEIICDVQSADSCVEPAVDEVAEAVELASEVIVAVQEVVEDVVDNVQELIEEVAERIEDEIQNVDQAVVEFQNEEYSEPQNMLEVSPEPKSSDSVVVPSINDTVEQKPTNLNEVAAQEREKTLCERLSEQNKPQTFAEAMALKASQEIQTVSIVENSVLTAPEPVVVEPPLEVESIAKIVEPASDPVVVKMPEPVVEPEAVVESEAVVEPEPVQESVQMPAIEPISEVCQVPPSKNESVEDVVDDELLKSMRESGSRKAKLYDLYSTDEQSASEPTVPSSIPSTLSSTTHKAHESAANVETPVKRKIDFAVALSLLALGLAALVTIYYFFVRG